MSHESPDESLVRYEVADGVATVTLDSPHNRNALSRRLVTELLAALERAAADEEARVVVLAATGKVFCSGADLSEAAGGSMEEGALTIVAIQRAVAAHPKPVVARLQGPVRAGGIGLVAASDVVVSAEGATFALTEVKLGLAPAAISLTVLPRMTSRAASLAALGGEVFDVHALSGAYAVDALDDIERMHFERHLAECAECRHEVDSLREASGVLTEVAPVAPPAALRERLLADVATVRPLPPLVQEVPRRSRRFPVLVAAAAAVVAMVGVGGVVAVTQPWEDGSSVPEAGEVVVTPKAVTEVLQAPDAESVTRTFEDGAKATVTRSVSLGQAVIITEGMADPGEGLVYELWLQRDGRMKAAGFMPKGPDNVVLLSGDAATAEAVGITVEPEGGSNTPNFESAVVIDFPKA